MKEHIGRCSKAAGFSKSLLPTFSKKDSEHLKGTLDYLGVNIYTALLAKPINSTSDTCSWQESLGVDTYQPDSWKSTAASWLKVRRNIRSIIIKRFFYLVSTGLTIFSK